MRALLPDLIAQRRAADQDALLTRLVEAEVDGEQLTQEEVLGFVQLLLVAGQETTANLINNAVLCFIESPDQLARCGRGPTCCLRRSRRSCATVRQSSGCPARRGARSRCTDR